MKVRGFIYFDQLEYLLGCLSIIHGSVSRIDARIHWRRPEDMYEHLQVPSASVPERREKRRFRSNLGDKEN